MGRTLTNSFSLAYAVQAAFDDFTTAAGDWKIVEPNEVSNFGATITTVARNPISKNRGARKGTVTDLDAAVEFSADLTLDSFLDFIEGFAFATATNRDLNLSPSAVATSTDEYTVTALLAAQADKLEFTASEYASLIFARGFTNAGNNGIKEIDADIATSATAITVAENLVDETPPANAVIDLAGIRSLAASTDFTWDWDGSAVQATLTSVGAAIDFTTLGIPIGMFVHIGSPDGSGGVTNAFENSVANDMFGYARVVSVVAKTIVFDKVATALQFDDLTAPATAVDMLFGLFITNQSIDAAEFLERIFLFEGSWPNLFETEPPTPVADPDGFEYILNCFCNQFAWSLPLSDKSTATFAFVGTDADPPVDNASRRIGADTPVDPLQTTALNTSSNITRLRITQIDETGITTDFKSLTLTINNNVSPEKVLGRLGARFINIGNLAVSIEGNVLFTSGAVIAAIRNNETVGMDTIVETDDGAIITDIPAMTLGGGARELPVNESVQVALTGEAFIDPITGRIFGVSVLPVVP